MFLSIQSLITSMFSIRFRQKAGGAILSASVKYFKRNNHINCQILIFLYLFVASASIFHNVHCDCFPRIKTPHFMSQFTEFTVLIICQRSWLTNDQNPHRFSRSEKHGSYCFFVYNYWATTTRVFVIIRTILTMLKNIQIWTWEYVKRTE